MINLILHDSDLAYKVLCGDKSEEIMRYSEFIRTRMLLIDEGNIEPLTIMFGHDLGSEDLFTFMNTTIESISIVNLRQVSEMDALKSGFTSTLTLLHYLEVRYPNMESEHFVRIKWQRPQIIPRRLAETRIDWNPNEKLYTLNPLVLSRKTRHCFYRCRYCYVDSLYKRFPDHFVEGVDLSRLYNLRYAKDNVFINSTTDLFHPLIPDGIIRFIIEQIHLNNINRCKIYFLTKNPERYKSFLPLFDPELVYLGATIETDTYLPQYTEYISKAYLPISDAPAPMERIKSFQSIRYPRKFVSVEPIMRFTNHFADEILNIQPIKIIIGANTSSFRLREPSEEEVQELIEDFQHQGIEVREKVNLSKLYTTDPTNHTILEFLNLDKKKEKPKKPIVQDIDPKQ